MTRSRTRWVLLRAAAAMALAAALLLSVRAISSWSGQQLSPIATDAGQTQELAVRESAKATVVARSGGDSGGVTETAAATWVRETAERAGIPVPAVRAYADATLHLQTDQPDCALGWTTLAGIGYVESQHGTLGGRTLDDQGRSHPLILGPALDGSGQYAAIPVGPSSARWHDDTTWDRAVGPLQFIPESWERWSSDGDGDGRADPNDLDDAALAAGRYLCADGHVLDDAGWSTAVFSYNHSDTYVRQVYDAAVAYAQRVG